MYANYPYGSYVGNQSYQQQPYQQSLNNQIQNNIPQQNIQQNKVNNYIQCEYVDSIDVIKSQNCDMSGRPVIYMKTDGSEIYRKQLNPSTGIGDLYIYKVQQKPEDKLCNPDSMNTDNKSLIDFDSISLKIEKFQDNISKNIEKFEQNLAEIKNIVLDNVTSPKEGGVAK